MTQSDHTVTGTDRYESAPPSLASSRHRFAPRHPRLNLLRPVDRDRPAEPSSLGAARATIDARYAALPRRGRMRRLGFGAPLAVLATDLTALIAVVAVVPAPAPEVALFAGSVLAVRAALRQYRPRLSLSMLDDLPRCVGSALAALGVAMGVTYLVGPVDAVPDVLSRTGLFLAFSIALQTAAFAVVRRSRRHRASGRRTLIIGAGRVGHTLAAALREHPELGLAPVGFADPDPTVNGTEPMLTTDMRALPQVIAEHAIDTTVLAFRDTGEAYVDTIMVVHQTGCSMLLVPSMFELHHDGTDVERVRGIPLLRLRPDPTLRVSWWIKRAFDVLVGGIGLLLLSVPLAIIALGLLIESGRPVLFWQERVGLDGRPFRLCKFRTMRPESEHDSATTWNIGDDPRVSRFARLLRRASLDELPQLWNIVRGQMSIVGPRPERPVFVRRFSAEHERYWARHRVPVGLTGLAQVNGLRGDTSIRERARYDNYYIANWSLWLDAKVILLTVREVLRGGGR